MAQEHSKKTPPKAKKQNNNQKKPTKKPPKQKKFKNVNRQLLHIYSKANHYYHSEVSFLTLESKHMSHDLPIPRKT